MENFFQWGLELITIVQQTDMPILEYFFKLVTMLGDEMFYLVLFPFLLWCIDFNFGLQLGVIFLFSVYVNAGIKNLFQLPRPFEILPDVQKINASGFGFPSGHAQSSLVTWGSIALWKKQSLIRIFCIVLIFLIGFSRIYLGVHFPMDVLGGWFFGIIILMLGYLVSFKKRMNIFSNTLILKLLLISLVSAILLIFQSTLDMISSVAALAGVGYGLVFFQHSMSGLIPGNWIQRIISFFIGMIGIAILYFGLKILLPGEGHSFNQGGRFLRYLLLGTWISFGAPRLFIQIGLARQAK